MVPSVLVEILTQQQLLVRYHLPVQLLVALSILSTIQTAGAVHRKCLRDRGTVSQVNDDFPVTYLK